MIAIAGCAFEPPPIVPSVSRDGRPWVEGIVTDRDSGKPLPWANVILIGTKVGTQSDARGHYRLALPDTGSSNVMALRLGYDRQVLGVKGTGPRVDTLHFRLRKQPPGSVIQQ